MKLNLALIMALVLILLFSGTAASDELSDLKQQVDELQKKTEELGKNQEKQEKAVNQIQKQPSASSVVSSELTKLPTIGGHFKFFLADQSSGERNNDDQHNTFSAGINNLWLYFSKNLTDFLQITVAPELAVEAAATPSIGSDIKRTSSASVEVDLDEAYMSLRLPWQLELRVGSFYPAFSEEYATKAWWHEQYHANNGLVTLEAWQSIGLEIYRNFDFEHFSLPVYFYPFLNGEDRGIIQDSRFVDNNNTKNLLVHITPEFYALGSRIRLLGSFGWGRWDSDGENDSLQWAAGLDFTRGSISLSGEYLSRSRNDLPLIGGGTEDGEDSGWYLRLKYTLSQKWRFLLKYSDVDLWAPGTDALLTDNYQTVSGAVNYWITDNSTIIPQIEWVDAEREGSTEELNYIRYTLGWRTTF